MNPVAPAARSIPEKPDPANVRRSGYAILKLLIVSSILFAMIGGIYVVLLQVTRAMRCGDQLGRIYQALELYELSHGALPRLAFYPDEPMTDPESIRVVLESYGLDSDVWICPASHRVVAESGLSYVWNTRLNGLNLRELKERQWLLIEINALSPDVPAPHIGAYNVLYSDGTVERMRDPSTKLPGL